MTIRSCGPDVATKEFMAAAMTGLRAGINDLDWLPEVDVVPHDEAAT